MKSVEPSRIVLKPKKPLVLNTSLFRYSVEANIDNLVRYDDSGIEYCIAGRVIHP
jgi:hypothetical protein